MCAWHYPRYNVRPYPYNGIINERKEMPRYYVKTVVQFSQEVEADNEADAEAIGWEWEDKLAYDFVESIDVEELEEEEED